MNAASHRFLYTAAMASLLCAAGAAAQQIPVVGVPVPELAALDTKMTDLMTARSISAASLTVSRQGTILFQHAYGWQDRAKSNPIRPDVMFRIASCTKPFTAAAVRKLISDGKLSLDSKVFSLGVPGAGILDQAPFGTPSVWLGEITVNHLLQHRGGWNPGYAPGDLTYQEIAAAAAMGVPSPPGPDNTVRYIMGQPLRYRPGTAYVYSNVGYFLLGMIIEKVSGQSYADYLQQNLLTPEGTASSEWLLGRSFAADQNPREPFYDDPGLYPNVFYPAYSSVPTVERPYGSFDMESRNGQGRIVAQGSAIVRLLHNHRVFGDEIGGPRPADGSFTVLSHNGAQYGAEALSAQRGDGVDYAVMFNKWNISPSYNSNAILTTLEAFFNAGGITWPAADVTQIAPKIPQVTITFGNATLESGPWTLSFPTEPGRHYQCQRSTDMVNWEDHRAAQIGTGGELTVKPEFTPIGFNQEFYRVVVR